MAQDFMAAFGYGLNERYLSTIDMDGVTLASIQGLNAKLEDTRVELATQAEISTALRWLNAQLHGQNVVLRSRSDALEARLARLEKAILREHEPDAIMSD